MKKSLDELKLELTQLEYLFDVAVNQTNEYSTNTPRPFTEPQLKKWIDLDLIRINIGEQVDKKYAAIKRFKE